MRVLKKFRPADLDNCLDHVRDFFDGFAASRESWRQKNASYYRELEQEFRFRIEPGRRVLEVGCAVGDLLAAMQPAYGLGVDVSPAMIELANSKYGSSSLEFVCAPIERLAAPEQPFDYIILSDFFAFSYDIKLIMERLRPFCHPRTRLVINYYSRVWQPLYSYLEKTGRKSPLPILNWVSTDDVVNLLELSGYEVISARPAILAPKRVPFISRFLNRFLAPFPPFRWFCFSTFVVARPVMEPLSRPATVSVVCPCRNEAGNIENIVRRLPDMGASTELIFVEGHSLDDTYEQCLKAQQRHPEKAITVLQQPGKGKNDAVRLGFARARGEVLMILDSDLSVPPEDLPSFYDVLMSGEAEFFNGSRLVYAMEEKAMRFLNLLANRFFGMAFTFLLGQTLKDTLCGTKVLLAADYVRLDKGRTYFGEFDPFGDFDLLFGAAKLGLRIRDLPVRYRERVYGETNISRFRHGFMLLHMCFKAFTSLKCH